MDQVRFQNAVALRDSGRIDDAIREFRLMAAESRDNNEKASIMINEVRCYCDLGRLGDAERALGQIRKLAPDDVVVRVNVDFGAACVAAQRKEWRNAVSGYEGILQDYSELLRTPEYLDLYEDVQERRAFALVNLGRFAQAIALLEEACSFSTLSLDHQQQIHLYLGICRRELGEDNLAKMEFLNTIEFGLKNDIDAQARYRLGVLYFTQGVFAQAKYQLEAILEDYQRDIPNLPRSDIYKQLSYVCHFLGEEQNEKRYSEMARQ